MHNLPNKDEVTQTMPIPHQYSSHQPTKGSEWSSNATISPERGLFQTGPAQKKWDRVINLAPQLRLSLAGLEEQIFPANPKSFYHKTSSHHSQRIDRRNLGPDNEEVRNKNNSHGVLMLFVCDFKLYSYSLRPSNISRKQHLQKMFPCVINSGGDQVSHALPASHLMVFHAFQSTSHS